MIGEVYMYRSAIAEFLLVITEEDADFLVGDYFIRGHARMYDKGVWPKRSQDTYWQVDPTLWQLAVMRGYYVG